MMHHDGIMMVGTGLQNVQNLKPLAGPCPGPGWTIIIVFASLVDQDPDLMRYPPGSRSSWTRDTKRKAPVHQSPASQIGNSRDDYQFIFKKGLNSDRFQLFQCENCLDTSTELLEKDSYVIVLRGSQKPDDFLQDDLFLAQGEVHCLHFSSATIYSS